MNKADPKVDAFISNARRWREEMKMLRTIARGCGLTEALKWRQPCYSFQNGNVVIIGELKESCTLSFFKGALLKDPYGILEKPGENSQSARHIRFTGARQIAAMEPILKAYISEAVAVERAGLKVEFEKNPEPVPAELQDKFAEFADLKNAFDALTPGRQRGYILYFSAPKQSKTRTARIEKYTQRILDGKGIHDCICGLSNKLPACDGSHKQLSPVKRT